MLITKEIQIDMGHRVPNHNGKCKNLHGHRYRIEVGVDDKVIATPGVSAEGMVIDFTDLKILMMEEIELQFDHKTILNTEDPVAIVCEDDFGIVRVDFIPTAENLAKYWFHKLLSPLKDKFIKLSYVKVWETPTSTAIYTIANFESND